MYDDNFYKSFISESINPFILFNSEAKLIDFNYEAEILFNYVKPSKLFDLAISNSPHNFGFERKYIDLKYGKLSFYAIVVGYIDDQYLGLQLYKYINTKKEMPKIQGVELVNIFSLIEISKNTNIDLINTKTKEIYDTSIPEIKVNINDFLLTLNECFSLFKDHKNLTITVKVKVGEYKIIDNKRYNIIEIIYSGDKNATLTQKLEKQASKSHIDIFEINGNIQIEFPLF